MIFGIALLSVLLMYTTVSADATVQHIVGIVTAIDEKHVEVKTPNKKAPVSVKLSKQVRFKNKGNPASNEPPTVGDRVIIEATKENKILTATVVHYSSVKNAPVTPQ
jgi:hypothetical protein